ncbi:hypothetical protein C7U92_25670 [Bradyrhizobium sp. WBOS7]|nr:hypothetical protein [Bradyrhizobium sp. WBOS2]MDD1574245.1 hypothetical protein [Bradyrhizobium sp. WBOS1]MDD1580088.1 hypothetical protein [Bradyrhizobium sp. WBOS7]MDD1603985.1 hypothetical protein [Bradyrhizobium sp. WBOS16]
MNLPSPLVGEGGAKRRMRGLSPQVQLSCESLRETPHPSRRYAASHPLPLFRPGRWWTGVRRHRGHFLGSRREVGCRRLQSFGF